MQQMILLQILLLAQYVSGTIMPIIRSSSIIQVVAACRIWCLVFTLSVWCGAEGCVSCLRACHLYNTLELPMMGIMVPETC